MTLAPGDIYLIRTDGGGSYQFYIAALQQRSVGTRARADNYCVCIAYQFRRKSELVGIYHFPYRFQAPLDEGDIIIYYKS
jgi:hypothetical protein